MRLSSSVRLSVRFGVFTRLMNSTATGWTNTECRSYEFKDPTGADPDASLQETNSSWRQRRGSAIPLTDTEQRQIRSALQNMLEEEEAEHRATREKAEAAKA